MPAPPPAPVPVAGMMPLGPYAATWAASAALDPAPVAGPALWRVTAVDQYGVTVQTGLMAQADAQALAAALTA